jgi:hypothetical protein
MILPQAQPAKPHRLQEGEYDDDIAAYNMERDINVM